MKALIFGVNGQDGSHLAEILLEKGYEVHGVIRHAATGNTKNIEHITDKITLHRGDMLDPTALYAVVKDVAPDEIYNEADQDHGGWSFSIPYYQYNVTGVAVGALLEIVRQLNPKIKVFQPVSAQMFGKSDEVPQKETTPFRPTSPYACAKIFAYYLAKFYRDTFGMFVATGIFYNHESPRRNTGYVTRKITRTAAAIKLGLTDKIELGDLSARLDWGYSKEYMDIAWRIMQLPAPDDFVVATGEAHSVEEFAEEAFRVVGLEAKKHVRVNPKFLRPGVNAELLGDITKLKNAIKYEPQVKFKELVKLMVEADLEDLTKNPSSFKTHE